VVIPAGLKKVNGLKLWEGVVVVVIRGGAGGVGFGMVCDFEFAKRISDS
jgi:hypothetical protein